MIIAAIAVYRVTSHHSEYLCVAGGVRQTHFFSRIPLLPHHMIPTLWPGHVTRAWVSSKWRTQPPPSREQIDLVMMKKMSLTIIDEYKKWPYTLSRCVQRQTAQIMSWIFHLNMHVPARNRPWFFHDSEFFRKILNHYAKISRSKTRHICFLSHSFANSLANSERIFVSKNANVWIAINIKIGTVEVRCVPAWTYQRI